MTHPFFYLAFAAAAILLGTTNDSVAQTVRLMTYNIYYGGQDHDPVVGRNEEWLQVIKSRNPDILVLEEANGWLPSEQDYIAAYVDSLNAAFPDDPPHVGVVGDANSLFNVALITRLPIASFESYTGVNLGTEWVSLAHGFIHAQLEDPVAGTIHVLGVHFKSGENREAREAEGRALIHILEELPPEDMKIIAGDFNSYSPVDIDPKSLTQPDYEGGALPAEVKGAEPIEYLLAAGYEDLFRDLHPTLPGYTQGTEGFHGYGPIQRVDFVLRSPQDYWVPTLAERVTDGLGHVGSDHYAMFTLFERDPAGIEDHGGAAPRLWVAPNPTSGTSRIEFALTSSAHVSVQIFAASGRFVRNLWDGERSAGTHRVSWDGTDATGRFVPDGKYFVRLTTGSREMTTTILRNR